MGFTDNCNIFAAFHEDGFNQIIGHIRRQRPSLFNYATAGVADQKLLCKDIDAHPIVYQRSNPLVTITQPLPIPGSAYGVNFAVQLADLRLDFHPGNVINNLPPELNPPLKKQRMALLVDICGGIGCPNDDVIREFTPRPDDRRKSDDRHDTPKDPVPIRPLPTRDLMCFCLTAYVTGGFRNASYNGTPYLEPFVDGFEIVDIKPEGLENSLECYISLLLKLVVMPGLRLMLKDMPFNLTKGATDLFPQPTNVTISAMPTSAALPNNPAIEDDQLKVFIKAKVN